MTVAVYLILAVIVGVLAAVLSLTLVIWASRPPVDTGMLGIALAVMFATWSFILWAIFGRWPGSVSSEAGIDVGAAPYDVWEVLAIRDDYPGWKQIYLGVERLNEPGEVYRLHYAEDSACTRCSLPRDPDRSRWSSRVEILEARRPFLYRQRSFPKWLSERGGADNQLLDSEDLTIQLHPLGGGTRLTCRSTVVRPKAWMAFLTKLARPVKEHLRSLKAHVEGKPDETLFGIAAKRMKAARAAPQRCSCVEPG